MWGTLRSQIKTLLTTISTIEEVSDVPKIRFEGYPAVHIVPSDNTGDYETNLENIRTYAFVVRALHETKNVGIEKAFTALEQVVDTIIDIFDQEDLKGGDTRTLGINAPATYTFLNVYASPNKWGEFPDEEVIMAEITLKVRFSVDVS